MPAVTCEMMRVSTDSLADFLSNAGKFLGIAKKLGIDNVSFDTPSDTFFNMCGEKTPVRVSVLAKLHYDHGFPLTKLSKLTKRRGDDFLDMVVNKKAKEDSVAVVATASPAEAPNASNNTPATPQTRSTTRVASAPPAPSPATTNPQQASGTARQNSIFNNAIAAAQQTGNPKLLAQLQLAAAVAGASNASGTSGANKTSKK